MYNQHLEVKLCNTGKGIFTKIEIPANSVIMEFSGVICSEKELPRDSSIYLQIGLGRYLSPTGTVKGVDYINHSCDPNCYVRAIGNRAFLHSIYVISPNNQLTFDYSTTSTDTLDEWKMECHCGTNKCRKLISGFQYLEDDIKQNYKERGLVPLFITNPIFMRK